MNQIINCQRHMHLNLSNSKYGFANGTSTLSLNYCFINPNKIINKVTTYHSKEALLEFLNQESVYGYSWHIFRHGNTYITLFSKDVKSRHCSKFIYFTVKTKIQ